MRTILLLAMFMGLAITPPASAQDVFADIQMSHIEGNVPTEQNFASFLNRDLRAYFKKRLNQPVTVQYEPLRDGATQSGVSYPKFYLWVTVSANKKTVMQGAVRVAAIDKKYFEVTDFLSVSDMRKNPQAIDATFPLPVGAKIRERLKGKP